MRQFLTTCKRQPTASILLIVAVVTIFISLFTLTPLYGPPEVLNWGLQPNYLNSVLNSVISVGVGGYTIWAVGKNDPSHMAKSALGLFIVWFLSGVMRILVVVHPFQLLWVPFILVAMTMGVIYIDLQRIVRAGTGE